MKMIFRVLIPLFLLVCLASTVLAADSTVTWNGMDKGFAFAPGSNYTTTDLFDNFKEVMPGDVRTEVVTVSNRADDSDYIKIYMRTDTHDDPETQMFLSALSIKVSNGENVLFEGFADVTEPILLGKLLPDESLKLDVTLTAPLTLGNEYSGKIGEVDWIFLVEAFDEPTPPPVVKQQLTVRKVWDDDGFARPEQVTVALLRDGNAVETVVLNRENQWIYTWSELDDDAVWTVEETEVPDGYTASYKIEGSTVTIVNKKDPVTPPPITPTQTLTVRKIWNDTGAIRPTEISVDLLRNGNVYQTMKLNEGNQWKYTWTGLTYNDVWTVQESDVPDGYTVSYHTEGSITDITNTEIVVPPLVTYESLTVEKIWEDDGSIRPLTVEIALLCNGETAETVILNAENSWRYTWNELSADAVWTIAEQNVPDGYVVSYRTEEDTVTVINTQIPVEIPVEPISLTVVKVWDDAHYPAAKRPDSVSMTLYNGEEAIESVLLGAWNDWTFTWSALDADGDWSIVENSVEGYTPYYSVSGDIVTVTNTAILLQTGQLKWPIPVIAGCGLLLIGIGILLLSSKKEKNHAS